MVNKVCLECGQLFQQKEHTQGKYCSQNCYRKDIQKQPKRMSKGALTRNRSD